MLLNKDASETSKCDVNYASGHGRLALKAGDANWEAIILQNESGHLRSKRGMADALTQAPGPRGAALTMRLHSSPRTSNGPQREEMPG